VSYMIMSYRAYEAYQEIKIRDSYFDAIKARPMEKKEREILDNIVANWNIYLEKPVGEEWITALKSAGYSNDVNGLFGLWTAKTPKFSFIKIWNNKKWSDTVSLRESWSPLNQMFYYGDNIIFTFYQNHAVVHESRNGELYMTIYQSPTKEIEQATPRNH
jgi:hypothetical protein